MAELLKMREAFINPLLHPYTNASSSTMIKYDDPTELETLIESFEHLPIASRFLPSSATGSDESEDHNGNARTTSHASHRGGQSDLNSSPENDPLEHPTSWTPGDSSALPRSSQLARLPRGVARRFQLSVADSIAHGGISPHQLPDDLRVCLESIEDVLAGHIKLAEVLRKRYDEQYPLVRSLTDIFMDNVRMLFYCPGRLFTLALVTHLPRLCGLCFASRTGPRPS